MSVSHSPCQTQHVENLILTQGEITPSTQSLVLVIMSLLLTLANEIAQSKRSKLRYKTNFINRRNQTLHHDNKIIYE